MRPFIIAAAAAASLALAACGSCNSNESSGSPDAPSASGSPAASSSAPPPPAPLSTTPPLAPPRPVPADAATPGFPGAHVIYAQERDLPDDVKLVGVDRHYQRALLEITRPKSDAATQLVTVDLARGTLTDTWSPSNVFARVVRNDRNGGPQVADALGAQDVLQADLAGWSKRLAWAGSPWSDGILAGTPGGSRAAFGAGNRIFLVNDGRVAPTAVGAVGALRGVLFSPDGNWLAWGGVVDFTSNAQPRLVFADVARGGAGEVVSGITEPEALTWGPDSVHVYLFANEQSDAAPATGCLHVVDVRNTRPKLLTCVGTQRGLAVSPNGSLAVLSSKAADAKTPSTDLVEVSLPDGQVKRRVRLPLPITPGSGIVDDTGSYVTLGFGEDHLIVTVDFASGKQKIARGSRDLLALGSWVAPRSFVVLRTTPDKVQLERVDLDGLAPAPAP